MPFLQFYLSESLYIKQPVEVPLHIFSEEEREPKFDNLPCPVQETPSLDIYPVINYDLVVLEDEHESRCDLLQFYVEPAAESFAFESIDPQFHAHEEEFLDESVVGEPSIAVDDFTDSAYAAQWDSFAPGQEVAEVHEAKSVKNDIWIS